MNAETLHLDITVVRGAFQLSVSQDVPLAGTTVIFGPSGSGKTTLLRTVAGFVRPRAGTIAAAGDVWFDARRRLHRPPHRRPVGFVFQDSRLFSHLSAAGNLRFAERRARADGVRLDRTAIIEALDLEPLLERKPATLSGGERQRVALARALLGAPRLMLLDEPLTALDRARRARTTRYLTGALHRFGVPSLHITHDVDEALAVADRVLVLREGQVQGFGEPEAMISRALELGEAGDLSVIVRGVVVRRDTALKLTEVAVEGQPLYVPLNAALTPGMRTALRLRARDVMIAVQPPHSLSVQNVLSGVITSIEPDVSEAFVTVTLTTPLGPVYAHITHAAREVLDLEPGGQVFALIKSLHVLA